MGHRHLLRRILPIGLLIAWLAAAACPTITARAADPVNWFAVSNPSPFRHLCSQSDPCSLATAVYRAADGDRIYLAGGTYISTEPAVLILTKSITLNGGWDGASLGRINVDPLENVTYLDGEDARRVIIVEGDASPTFNGLTITRGMSSGLTGNEGGGIYINNPTGGTVTLNNCALHNNSGASYAGGASIQKGTLNINNSTVTNNRTTYGGAAFFIAQGAALHIENSILSNTVSEVAQYGTLLHNDRGSVTIRRSMIHAHMDTSSLISVNPGPTASLTLENNIFSNNAGTLLEAGGSVPMTVAIRHNTFYANSSDGLEFSNLVFGEVSNNIFTEFTKGTSINIWGENSSLTVDHNLFWNNLGNLVPGNAPVQADPLLTWDFHLMPGSPAIEAGTASATSVDFDGQKRPLGVPDIGVDEYYYGFLYLPAVVRQ